MKIAYDHQIFGWQEYGGISRYFFELANNIGLRKSDEVAIISPLYVNSYVSAASSELRVMGRKMPAIRRTGRIYRAINRLLAPSMMKGFAPEVVHETYYSQRSIAPKSSKVVLTVHDMIHELFPECFPSWDQTSAEKSAAVKRADHIICVSENTKSDLVRILGVDPMKISVVHHGFTLTNETENRKSASGRPYLLYVGSRNGYKNYEGLLRAYADNLGLSGEFDLVAFGGGGFSSRERAIVKALGLSDAQVRHVEGDDAVLAGLYRGAALFVYPSRYEGFGIPPLEAMSFDCPVACSNRSSVPEVVGDAAVYFDPDSSQSMVRAIESVLNDVALRQALVLRGRARLRQYSWQRCAEETLDVYRRLLS